MVRRIMIKTIMVIVGVLLILAGVFRIICPEEMPSSSFVFNVMMIVIDFIFGILFIIFGLKLG
jgi:uncharacterized membrane protein HdeD (DUF308 family)